MTPAIVRKLVRGGRNTELTWRYLFNLTPTLSYKFQSHRLSSEAANVLADLNRDGIAITSVGALLGANQSSYERLTAAVHKLEGDMSPEIKATQTNADDLSSIGTKTFLTQLLGQNPVFDPEDVFAQFALQPSILKIANGYFQMYTRLRYYNVWHTCRTRVAARESQLWHRDREDRLILKVFVYLSDVDDGAGPFTYVTGSHLKGNQRREPTYHLEGGVKRSTDEQMAEVNGPESWMKGIGPRGTIIFADTRGYHKGGLAREHDRIMYTCMFTSQASQSQELMNRSTRFNLPRNRQQSFAVSLSKKRS